MKSVLLTLVAGLAMVFAASTAEAGGGGTKPNSTIIVKNNTGSTIAVIVDPSTTLDFTDQAKFKAAGGKIVNAGGSATFSVKAGDHSVAGAEIVGTTPGTISSQSVTTKKNKTLQVKANDDGSGGIDFVPAS